MISARRSVISKTHARDTTVNAVSCFWYFAAEKSVFSGFPHVIFMSSGGQLAVAQGTDQPDAHVQRGAAIVGSRAARSKGRCGGDELPIAAALGQLHSRPMCL